MNAECRVPNSDRTQRGGAAGPQDAYLGTSRLSEPFPNQRLEIKPLHLEHGLNSALALGGRHSYGCCRPLITFAIESASCSAFGGIGKSALNTCNAAAFSIVACDSSILPSGVSAAARFRPSFSATKRY